MPWSTVKNFGFRATSGYVTDGSNDTYVLLSTTYPTTRTVGGDSVTFGWESAPDNENNRTTLYAPHLAGANNKNPGGSSECVFRVDLPSAGDYRIRLAMGDPSTPIGYFSDIRDTASVLTTYGSATGAASDLRDATDVDRFAYNWTANNQPSDQTFSTSVFRYVLRPMTSAYNGICCVSIEQLSGGASRVHLLNGKLGFPLAGKL